MLCRLTQWSSGNTFRHIPNCLHHFQTCCLLVTSPPHTHVSTGGELRWRTHFLAIKPESHYWHLPRNMLISLPLHISLSPKEHLTDWLLRRLLHVTATAKDNPYQGKKTTNSVFFNVLLTVPLSISLHNDQLDAHFLYFTICPLQSSTCFKRYMLIIRRLIALMQHLVSSTQQWPSSALDGHCWKDDTRCCISEINLLMMSM